MHPMNIACVIVYGNRNISVDTLPEAITWFLALSVLSSSISSLLIIY